MDSANPRETIGGNNPPPYETMTLRCDELLNGARKIMTDHPALITDTEVGERLGGFLRQMKEAMHEADDYRAEEKAPHLKAANAVDEKWKPFAHKEKSRFAVAIAAVSKKVEAYLIEQNRLRREKENEARAEAARQAQIAQDAIDKAARLAAEAEAGTLKGTDADPIQAQIDAEEATKTAKVAVKAANELKGNVNVGSSFAIDGVTRGVALRTTYHAKIEKPLAALAYFAKSEKLLDVLQGLCNAHVRSSDNPDRDPPPGCSVYTTQSAS